MRYPIGSWVKFTDFDDVVYRGVVTGFNGEMYSVTVPGESRDIFWEWPEDRLEPALPPLIDPTLPKGTGVVGDFTQIQSDPVHHPAHYTQGPVEVIEITERLNFCLGNVIKYVLRADHKGNPIEDLKKAAWHLERELQRRQEESA